MGFIDFLGGAVKILFGGGLFLIGILFGSVVLTYGYTIVGIVSMIVGLIGGLYATYERGQQKKRI
ncbi:hypothetical protein DJ82_13440 [Halorubrum sp. Ib24]|uniref:hypothetical protein n=1 Tax=Halorubrum sp. Ib24 TaxID=1383850 RepID=UPI000B982E86|nr:hypothetical protein [Halorubrum sp. Ib24]OYR37944.1 hypothetical protein DJ82_13440 [Halorubrum sp. Ib24]